MQWWLGGVLLGVLLFGADDSFITKYEYGQMLYKNPRGIGCIYCHGRHGKGGKIVTYRDKGATVTLKAPDIRHLPLQKLSKSLKKRHRVMPTYYLTDQEIKALHYYLGHKE